MNDHCGDDAELYALGELDAQRAHRIDEHTAHCAPCRARVIEAEATAAALAAMLPAMPAAAVPRVAAGTVRVPRFLAAAAVLIFAFAVGTEGFALRDASMRSARTETALAAVAASHFSHTTLASGTHANAKVLYARDGSWLYVLASGFPSRVHVVARTAGRVRDLGSLGQGDPSSVFVTGTGRIDDVALVDGERVIAHASPQY